MKKLTILLFIFLLSGFLSAQVNVTITLNTSTNLDTLTADNGTVQIRGALGTVSPAALAGGDTITWDGKSTLDMTNIGGDYWQITFQVNANDTLRYKFWTGLHGDLNTGTAPDGGWEGAFELYDTWAWDTRTLVVGDNDTTLDVQYYHHSGTTVNQYWRPFESKTDSVAVYFRVSLGAQIENLSFDPISNSVVVRGAPTRSCLHPRRTRGS